MACLSSRNHSRSSSLNATLSQTTIPASGFRTDIRTSDFCSKSAKRVCINDPLGKAKQMFKHLEAPQGSHRTRHFSTNSSESGGRMATASDASAAKEQTLTATSVPILQQTILEWCNSNKFSSHPERTSFR